MRIHFLREEPFENKKVVMRVDFNVSLNTRHQIANDERIRQAIPTLNFLLERGNRVVLLSHLEPPEEQVSTSLDIVAQRLQELMPQEKVAFIKSMRDTAANARLALMENVRHNPGEKANSKEYARELSLLGEVFVQDAFGVCHREHASVVGIAQFIPGYAGLLLEREIEQINKVTTNPTRPFIAVLGGAKIDSKLKLIHKLTTIADYVLLGGKMGLEYKGNAANVIIPVDYVYDEVGNAMDIGEMTRAKYEDLLFKAATILWNGPVGKVEDMRFQAGTKAVYHAIVSNRRAVSVVGGGDTITAISHENDLKNITHISTGGGAMLEYIEKGTLPGIEALKRD